MKIHFRKRLFVSRITSRLIAIVCFIAGMLAVWNWQLPVKREIPSRFLVQLQPEPETITQNRNLFDYERGGRVYDCFNTSSIEFRRCEASRNKARDFILKHWQDKKRAYIIVEFNGVDSFNDYHLFIEPDQAGQWRIVWRKLMSLSHREFTGNIDVSTALSVTKHQGQTSGSYYLIFYDKDGKEIGDL
jgi:hypothetical protein